ncbi:MAG: putative transposase, partial [Myxococcota bacterium]
MILGFSVGQRRLLTALWEGYGEHADGVSFSTFQGWFTPEFADLLKHLVQHTITEDRDAFTVRGHILERFTELIAIDSTIINLHRFLREHYKSTQKTGAAAKLHAAINILDASVK